ncbi:MAG: pseudouridine synthase [Bacteroidota bacterium]
MKHRHFILHKPFGYISQFKYNNIGKKRLLGELGEFPPETMAIGRLDEKSEGLLLLTTDGKMSEEVRSKKYEKEYYALVDGIPNKEQIKQLEHGVNIGIEGQKYLTRPSRVRAVEPPKTFPPMRQKIRDERHGPSSWLSIIIREGKYRQVRKMTAAVGLPTLRLVRVRIGAIELNDLPAGQSIEIPDFSAL